MSLQLTFKLVDLLYGSINLVQYLTTNNNLNVCLLATSEYTHSTQCL